MCAANTENMNVHVKILAKLMCGIVPRLIGRFLPTLINMRNKDTRGLAAEAAAIIAEGVPDWSEARRKLAEEYEITSGAQLPDDDAIESALREHYMIFDLNGHADVFWNLERRL